MSINKKRVLYFLVVQNFLCVDFVFENIGVACCDRVLNVLFHQNVS